MGRGDISPGARVELLGIPLDAVTMSEAVERCEHAIATRRYLQHVSINASKIVSLKDDSRMHQIVRRSGLVTADGQAICWASRLLGAPVPERVAGIDLMHELLESADRNGYRVYILGAKQEVLDTAVERLTKRYPRLKLAGARNGYFATEEVEQVCEEIRASQADILFIAISSPMKEYFLGDWGEHLGISFAMGVGGAIDVVAGVVKRAPHLMQRLGLEWAYRLLQEPRRLWRRYLATNARFIWMLTRALLTGRGSAGAVL